jgi:hypothetical protein
MPIFTGTVSTSGSSLVIAIPKFIVEAANLTKGKKVEIIYENDQIKIPLSWVSLSLRCEAIMYNKLQIFTDWIFVPQTVFHPFTHQVISSFLLLLKYVYIKSYGFDHFKVKFCDFMMKSLHTNIKTDHTDEFDIQYKEALRRGTPLEDIKINITLDPDEKSYYNYEEIQDLKKFMPAGFRHFMDNHLSVSGILQISDNGKYDYRATYEYIDNLITNMETEEFTEFLSRLWLMENIHQS